MRAQSISNSSVAPTALGTPPGAVEYIYSALLFYNNLGPVVGLPAGEGSGPMLLLLGIYCSLSLGQARKAVFQSLRLPILCAVFEILVQVLVHGVSPFDSHVRYFVNWIVGLVVIHSLFLRPGFLHRFALTLLCLSLTALPFLSSAEISRSNERAQRVTSRGTSGTQTESASGSAFAARI